MNYEEVWNKLKELIRTNKTINEFNDCNEVAESFGRLLDYMEYLEAE